MGISDVMIVGAGQAGGSAVMALRQAGFDGRIHLAGAEVHPPHERPPLSKGVLAGKSRPETTYLVEPSKLADLQVDYRFGLRAVSIDRADRAVTFDDGSRRRYDRLILTTGGRPRLLEIPGAQLPGVFYLRTIEDAIAIREAIKPGTRLAVIGGGWIGLEVAATARQYGAHVWVVEALDRICARVLPEPLSAFLRARHEREGVELLTNTCVEAIERKESLSICCSGGRVIDADLVVIGIGLVPEVALARAAGLEVDRGIVVDEQCRTTDPNIFAAGDCASSPVQWAGRRLCLESWANAQNQPVVAVRAALGLEARYLDIPWFWSDQYDLRLQMAGFPGSLTSTPVVRSNVQGKGMSWIWIEDGRVAAIVAVDAPREFRGAQRLMQAGTMVTAARLADSTIDLSRLHIQEKPSAGSGPPGSA